MAPRGEAMSIRSERAMSRDERKFYQRFEQQQRRRLDKWKVTGSGKFDNPKGIPDSVVIREVHDDYITVGRPNASNRKS
jgi:hypothetical protein